MHARTSNVFPVGGRSPRGVRSGPVCVPRHVSSRMTVLPLTATDSIVPFESGIASERSRYTLASENGLKRKQALATGDRSLEVILEFEVAFAKFEDRDVSRRANLERPALLEHREDPRGIDRCS